MRSAQFHSLSNKSQRAFRIVYQICCSGYGSGGRLGIRHIAAYKINMLRLPFRSGYLSVLREVEYHRTRPARAGYIESLAHRPCNIFRTANLIAPFRYRLRHSHEVDLLKGIGAECRRSHLSGYHDNGCRIKHGIGHTRKRIGGARTARYYAYPYLTAHTCIALGCVRGSLLVAHQYVIERLLIAPRIVVKRVKHRHYRTAGVTEDGIHTLVPEGKHKCFCSCNHIFLFLFWFFQGVIWS